MYTQALIGVASLRGVMLHIILRSTEYTRAPFNGSASGTLTEDEHSAKFAATVQLRRPHARHARHARRDRRDRRQDEWVSVAAAAKAAQSAQARLMQTAVAVVAAAAPAAAAALAAALAAAVALEHGATQESHG